MSATLSMPGATSAAIPPATIIINNYNYGRFLREAIESALAQSYPATEVIVVDDGSTDDSHAVIASFGERIAPILKENGGQASALNAGFAASHGEVIIFLDADDILYPTVMEQVVELFNGQAAAGAPEVVRVQYRLDVITGTGEKTGAFMPPHGKAIPSGDLRQQVIHYGDDIAWLPTSGNAFSAAMLRSIFPIPEIPYRICADYYLSNLSPLYGQVLALPESGGQYRVHGANNHQKAQLDLRQTRQLIVRTRQTHGYLQAQAKQLGLLDPSKCTVATQSLTYVVNRLLSLRLEPLLHPIEDDSRFALAWRGVVTAWRRHNLSLLLRLMYTTWFVLASLAPKAALHWLAEQFLYPKPRREWFATLFADQRRTRPQRKLQY
jgi:glycosyltransferase involved in cell wall biosynthesis